MYNLRKQKIYHWILVLSFKMSPSLHDQLREKLGLLVKLLYVSGHGLLFIETL